MQYEQERSGTDRRAESKCDMHKHNSELIETHGTLLTELRTGVVMVKWLVGIAVSLATVFFGLTYAQSAKNQEMMQRDLSEIKSVTMTVPMELKYVKEDIAEIRSKVR